MSGFTVTELLTQFAPILVAVIGLTGIIVNAVQAERSRHMQESLREIDAIKLQLELLRHRNIEDEVQQNKLEGLQNRLENLLAETHEFSPRSRRNLNLLPVSTLFLVSGTLIFLVARTFKPATVATSTAAPTAIPTGMPTGMATDTLMATPPPTDMVTSTDGPTEIPTDTLPPTETLTPTPPPTETLTFTPVLTDTPTLTLAPACPYQGGSDDETIRNLIQAEALGVNQKSMEIIRSIFAANAIFTDYSIDPPRKWDGPVSRYQDDLFTKYEFKDVVHIDISPAGAGISDITAWYTSGSTGYYRSIGGDWTPLANGSTISTTPPATQYGSEHWTLQKNDLGCWVIMQKDFNAGDIRFP